ncbi:MULTISPECIES: NADH:flavin oxidoreductase/NADH oxidase [unclassified Burkholderia]|uniref:NADH:flavin oxidoreductase/NADH oxidase n=1 Tax=unclassified Burkholderia TaxID=2613784 RepID=UPI000F57ED11|nr:MULTISPECIES: NADH:flavin oxidoreductase/NADH oxidase [unclassified Burkholderia]RQS26884.1 NADH:flavin oxidoreductase/NADH oxidase [Burkholderia sp. Bp8995]RQS51770.1 NADH:flavin oxidoreductase/NADH oxidase [Burkholderia sp. Bp8989]
MTSEHSNRPMLLEPFTLREVRLPNRMVLSPMQMYTAKDGFPTDWHLQHLAKFAVGGFGTVFTEALCTDPAGRSTYGDMGIWSDEFVPPLRKIADTLRSLGAVPAAQIHHVGPKAGRQRPWEGYGPLGAKEAENGEPPWQPVAPSADAKAEGWHNPRQPSKQEIGKLIEQFGAAARRCAAAGFDVLEVHAAHGYLIHSFYSPLGNSIDGEYGGTREERMRFALEVAEVVRANWPENKPLFFRLSCVDGADIGGWDIDDTIVMAKELQKRGVDLIDCSSGGIGLSPTAKIVSRQPLFQVPYSEAVRGQCENLPTMAVGLITEPEQAEAILQAGQADLIAIAREALFNPHWALHAAVALGGPEQFNSMWPPSYGWWIYRRNRSLELGRADRK